MLKKGRKIEFSKWGRVFRIRGRGRWQDFLQAEPFLKKCGGGGGQKNNSEFGGKWAGGNIFPAAPFYGAFTYALLWQAF